MEEDLAYDAQTRIITQRRHWYTCLWPSCLGCRCMHPQRRNRFPLYLIGYDPVGRLQRAASVGDLDKAEQLIHSSRHHVDESDRRNRTSLHYACAHNHPDVVTLLLENNSNINLRDDEGCTPLIKAAQRDNIDCVSILLEHNADPNLFDFSGNTAFHHAVSRGNIPIVQMLLKHNIDIEAKTQYGLTPLQLAAFEQKPEMVEFLEVMCANAHAPEEINGTETPAQKTRVKHVSFNEVSEVFYFKDEWPLSRGVRPPEQLKSILKSSSQYNTASDQTTRRTSLWCIKGNNVRHTSGNKEESNKPLRRLRKRMRNVFTKSEVYVCSRGVQIPDTCEEKTSVMVEGSKPDNFLHILQEQRISVPELPADTESTPSTSAAYSRPSADNEPTASENIHDSGVPSDIHLTSSTSAADIGAPIDTEPTSSCAPDTGATVVIQPTSSTCDADSRIPADTETTLSQHAHDSGAPAVIQPTASQHVLASGSPGDIHQTSSTSAADIGAPIDTKPTSSTCAPNRGTVGIELTSSASAADTEPPGSQSAHDSCALSNVEPTPSQCAHDSGSSTDIDRTSSTIAADIGAPIDTEPTSSTCAPETGATVVIQPTSSTCDADSRIPADIEPTLSQHAHDSGAPAVIQPTASQHVLASESPGDIHQTSSTSAADIGAPIDTEPTSSTCAPETGATVVIQPTSSTCDADSRFPADVKTTPSTSAGSRGAPADIEKTPSPCAAVSGAIADIEATFPPGPADIAQLEEHHNSETASDIELDFISDLAIYMEHARDTPCADPEPTLGPSTCSIHSSERSDLNIFTLLTAEDKHDSFSLDEEPTPVPDLDDHLAPTQDDDVFNDALQSADHTGQSKTSARDPGFLVEAEMLLLPIRPVVWVQNHLLSMMTWMRNRFHRVWHEENGQGSPTNKSVEPVAAAADH